METRARRTWSLPVLLFFALELCVPSMRARQLSSAKSTANSGLKNCQLSIVGAKVQMLLIAPGGKKTGFESRSQKIRKEIPYSAYYQDALLAYDSGRVDPNTTQTIDVNHPAAGTYRLVISPGTAADGEEYEVQIHLYSPDGGNLKTARIAGIAKRGKTATYELVVGGDPGTVAVLDNPKRK
jgi:hypothetical protein